MPMIELIIINMLKPKIMINLRLWFFLIVKFNTLIFMNMNNAESSNIGSMFGMYAVSEKSFRYMNGVISLLPNISVKKLKKPPT